MAEKKVIELEVNTKGLNSLKEQLVAARQNVQDLASQFGSSSQQVADAADQVRALEREIKLTNKTLKSVSFEGKFNAITGSISGVLSGMQAFQGSLGLIGVDSKNVESALLKVQSAMALAEGVEGIFQAQKSFKNLKNIIAETTVGQKLLAVATNIGTTAMKVFNTVVKSNPIGLVITAITALIGAFAFFSRETGKAKEAAENYTKALENQRRVIDANFETLQKRQKERIDLMKAQGKTEQQIFEQEQKNTKKLADEKAKAHLKEKYSYQNLRRLYKQLMDQGEEEEAEKMREQLKASRERYLQLQQQSKDYYHQISQDNKIFVAENAQKVKENAEKVRENARKVQEQQREDAREAAKKRAEDRKEAAEKEKAEKEKAAEEEKARLKAIYDAEVKANEERLKHQEDVYNLEISLIKDAREREIQELVNSYDAKFEVANGNAELEKQLTEQLNSDIAGINKKYADEAQKQKDEQDAKDVERLKAKREREQAINDFIFNSAKETLDLVSGLTEIFGKKGEKEAKKAFEIQKAVSIAQATIDTYKSANAIFAAAAANPSTVLFPAQPFIAAGLAVAAGLVNVAKIASQKFESKSSPSGGGSPTAPSGGGVGGAGSTSAIAPNFNIVGNAQATNPLAGLGGQPLQAYVVSGEVTTAQNLDRNRINYATFG